MKTTQITKIATHHRPHQDENKGRYLLKGYGEPVYPGISKADYWALIKPWDQFPSDTVVIGMSASEFDEHRNGARLTGKCAAILVAEKLRKEGAVLPEKTDRLLDEVLWCDESNEATPTVTATLVKVRHRLDAGVKYRGTYTWNAVAFDGILFGKADPEFNLEKHWAEFVKKNGIEVNSPTHAHISHMVSESQKRQRELVTEMSYVGSVLQPDVREPWLERTYLDLVKDHGLYKSAYTEVAAGAIIEEFLHDSFPKPLKVAFFEGENEHAKNVAFSRNGLNVALFVQRNPVTRQVQVFSNKNLNIDLEPLAVLVRLAEHQARRSQKLELRHAQGVGTVPLCPQWHLHNKKGMLANGTLTHPHIESSALTIPHMFGLINVAFRAATYEAWITQYFGGKPMEITPQAKPAEVVKVPIVRQPVKIVVPQPAKVVASPSAKVVTPPSAKVQPIKMVPVVRVRPWVRPVDKGTKQALKDLSDVLDVRT